MLAEPAGADDTARSLAAGERQGAFTPDTICDGLRTLVGAPNFELLRNANAEVIVVDDAATMAAMRLLWDVLKQVVEPSSATVLAAVLAQPQRFAGLRVGLVLSGGNVDLPALRWGRHEPRPAPPRTGLLGWLWRLFVVLVIWLLGVTAWIVWVGERDQAAKADAIIVLGAAAYDAKPSPVFEERIRHGLDLYEAQYAPLLIFTGGYGGTGARFSESQVARRYALKHGVPTMRS